MNREKEMWGIVTTHYQILKQFAEDTTGLINGSMLYDRHLVQPMFKLSIGNPGSSFAVEIARKIGLPAEIIQSAEDIVGKEYMNLDNYLLDITRDKRCWENKRTAIRQKEKKLEQMLAQYAEDADQLRSKRREIIEEARTEAKKDSRLFKCHYRTYLADIKEANAEREKNSGSPPQAQGRAYRARTRRQPLQGLQFTPGESSQKKRGSTTSRQTVRHLRPNAKLQSEPTCASTVAVP